jgi:acetyltransferase-like isoleucine patch superfamily enzyme
MRRLIRDIAKSLIPGRVPIVKGSTVGFGARIEAGAKVIDCTVANDAYVGPEARLFGVTLGAYSSIGPRVTIGENEHEQKLFSTSDILFECVDRTIYAAHRASNTALGPDVWIGANAFIRKGVQIGTGAIIGAHTVVLKDVPPYAIMVGVPARLIGYRFSPATRDKLIASRWWTLEKSRLQQAIVQRYGSTETPEMHSEQDILTFIADLDIKAGS